MSEARGQYAVRPAERRDVMLMGDTEADTLHLNGWRVGDILEGVENGAADRIWITAISGERFVCRWADRSTGIFERESGNTTLSCRNWAKVDHKPVAAPRPRVRLGDESVGRKDDGGKLRMDLLFADMPLALAEVVDVLTQGAEKYAPGNWQHVDDAGRRYLAASLRHELALARGQTTDPETYCHHLAHTICCDLFRLELALRSE